MNEVKILTILHLLSVTVWCQQEVNLINRLNAFYGFDHNIFLVDFTIIDYGRYIPNKDNNGMSCTPKTIFNFDQNLNSTNGTQLIPLKSLITKNTFLIIVVTNFQFENEKQIHADIKSIRRLDGTLKIAIFLERNVTSMDIIKQVFRWSWNAGIVNAICICNYFVEDAASSSLNVFRFDPFPTLKLIDVTESVSFENYFPGKVPNYHRHPIRFVRILEWLLQNLEIKFWETVVRVFNASMTMSSFDLPHALPYAQTDYVFIQEMIHNASDQIYPHRWIKLVMVVPHALPYSNFFVYLRNTKWTIFVLTLFGVIVIATVLLIVSSYLQTKKLLFFRCAADVINLLMNDNSRISYGKLHRVDVLVIVPLTFAGLIVVNGIISLFQSYVTLPMYERQINTIDDLYESPFNIGSYDIWADRTIEMLEIITGHGGWGEKVLESSVDEVVMEISNFNTSMAYPLFDNKAQAMLEVQKRLNIKAYHLMTNTNIDNFLFSFDLNEYFPFIEPINDIIHRLQAAGLMDKWFKDGELNRIKYILRWWKDSPYLQSNVNNGSDNDGLSMYTVVWCGWISSTILFVCEIVWMKINLKVMLTQRFDTSWCSN